MIVKIAINLKNKNYKIKKMMFLCYFLINFLVTLFK